jgi:hypothetical protein
MRGFAKVVVLIRLIPGCAMGFGICLSMEIIDFPYNYACHEGQGFL